MMPGVVAGYPRAGWVLLELSAGNTTPTGNEARYRVQGSTVQFAGSVTTKTGSAAEQVLGVYPTAYAPVSGSYSESTVFTDSGGVQRTGLLKSFTGDVQYLSLDGAGFNAAGATVDLSQFSSSMT